MKKSDKGKYPGLELRNPEGYMDPTAGIAVFRADKERIDSGKTGHGCDEMDSKTGHEGYMPLVYICSRYAGDVVQNIDDARRFCRFAAMKNTIPVAAQLLYPQFLDDGDAKEREIGLRCGLILLDRCREIWVFTADGTLSSGMKAEVERAEKRNKVIRYFDLSCREVKDGWV